MSTETNPKLPPITLKVPKKCKGCQCTDCSQLLTSVKYLLNEVAELKARVSNYDKSMKEENAETINSLVKEQTKNSQVKFQARLNSVEKRISSTVVNAKAKEESIHEVEERKRREKNFVVYGLPESDKTEPRQRCDDDKALVCETLKKSGIQVDQNELVSVFRAGKKVDNKNRPTVIKLSSKIKRDDVIQNGLQIKTKTDFRVSPDLTPMQRETLSSLYKQADERNQSDESKNYCWRVVGPREMPKLVRKPKQN
jgi:hypothetical protein